MHEDQMREGEGTDTRSQYDERMVSLLVLATVVRVVGASTIEVRENGKERMVSVIGLECLDATRAQCDRVGPARCAAPSVVARELLPVGSTVNLVRWGQRSSEGQTHTSAYVRMADGSDFGLRMLALGACDDDRHRAHPRRAEYRKASSEYLEDVIRKRLKQANDAGRLRAPTPSAADVRPSSQQR